MDYILSTCGTSILTNKVEGDIKQALTVNANAKNADDAQEGDRGKIEAHIRERREALSAAALDVRGLSAELNGILAYYGGHIAKGRNDFHCLLATDTWQGEATAGIVKDWLDGQGVRNVEVHRHPGLQTADWPSFQSSLADLVKWCEENVKPRRQPPRDRVVFNLSGGFKSETGFLQMLGMFYADEIIYLFERSAELMRIPRLPISMADEPAVRGDLRDFRRAAMGLSVTAPKSGVYWFEDDGQYTLTAWGEFVFARHKENFYAREVLDSPSDLVKFDPKFRESCRERFADINHKIDLLARYMEYEKRPNSRTLDIKKLKNGGNPRIPGATHELDAWHDGAAKRIYCRLEGEVIVLLRLGEHLR